MNRNETMKNKWGTGQKRAFLLGSKKDATGQGKLLNNMFQHRAGVRGSSVHVKSGSFVHVRRVVVCARFCCVFLLFYLFSKVKELVSHHSTHLTTHTTRLISQVTQLILHKSSLTTRLTQLNLLKSCFRVPFGGAAFVFSHWSSPKFFHTTYLTTHTTHPIQLHSSHKLQNSSHTTPLISTHLTTHRSPFTSLRSSYNCHNSSHIRSHTTHPCSTGRKMMRLMCLCVHRNMNVIIPPHPTPPHPPTPPTHPTPPQWNMKERGLSCWKWLVPRSNVRGWALFVRGWRGFAVRRWLVCNVRRWLAFNVRRWVVDPWGLGPSTYQNSLASICTVWPGTNCPLLTYENMLRVVFGIIIADLLGPRYEIQEYSAFFGKLDDAIQNPSDTQSGQSAWKIQVTSRTKRHERLLFSWDLLQNAENLWKTLGVRIRDRCVSIPIPFESASRLTQEKLVVYAEGNLSSPPITRVDHLRFHLYKLAIVGRYARNVLCCRLISTFYHL